jgi:ferredoxin
MPVVTLVREGRTLEVPEGANLRRALMDAGVDLYKGADGLLNCRGNGFCGTCMVEAEPAAALAPTTLKEKAKLWMFEGRPVRLSCQAKVYADCRVLTRAQTAQGWMAHPFYAQAKEGLPPARA